MVFSFAPKEEMLNKTTKDGGIQFKLPRVTANSEGI